MNVPRGLVVVAVMVVRLIVLGVLDQEPYWLSVAFGTAHSSAGIGVAGMSPPPVRAGDGLGSPEWDEGPWLSPERWCDDGRWKQRRGSLSDATELEYCHGEA